jgi:hypothetical protein
MASSTTPPRRPRSARPFWGDIVVAFGLIMGSAGPADAVQTRTLEAGQVCDAIAAHVSRESGVPLGVLQAITRTETGRRREGRVQPWPWTVNMEGRGVWFDTPDEARAYVFEHFKRGARSFDVGCFQINYRWHGQHFASIEEMFEPLANGRYAARFLSELHAELGNWSAAAGAYHSRTPTFANRYRAVFDRHRAAVEGNPPEVAETAMVRSQVRAPRENSFPLLQAGAGVSLGSLVPLAGLAPANRFIEPGSPNGMALGDEG